MNRSSLAGRRLSIEMALRPLRRGHFYTNAQGMHGDSRLPLAQNRRDESLEHTRVRSRRVLHRRRVGAQRHPAARPLSGHDSCELSDRRPTQSAPLDCAPSTHHSRLVGAISPSSYSLDIERGVQRSFSRRHCRVEDPTERCDGHGSARLRQSVKTSGRKARAWRSPTGEGADRREARRYCGNQFHTAPPPSCERSRSRQEPRSTSGADLRCEQSRHRLALRVA